MKLRILLHWLIHHVILLPLAAYLWTIDEVLFPSYRNEVSSTIHKPIITISLPRAGTTSFHRTLAMDPNLVTPTTSNVVLPFLCINLLLRTLHTQYPSFVQSIEQILKRLNGVTPEVEQRHAVSLFTPEADDVLIGEWHWVAVGSVRTFPVVDRWWYHYDFTSFKKKERLRILSFHKTVCQKVLYLHSRSRESSDSISDSGSGSGSPRLLLRSHLSPCIDDFKEMYPDAVFMGILRDPVDVLRSFAGLTDAVLFGAMGIQILPEDGGAVVVPGRNPDGDGDENGDGNGSGSGTARILDKSNLKTWPDAMQVILDDMMGREAELHNTTSTRSNKDKDDMNIFPTGYITFPFFKHDPVASIQNLYHQVGMGNLSDGFRTNLSQQVAMEAHRDYKTKHSYVNPTLEEMGVDVDTFLSLEGVQRYKRLFDEEEEKRARSM